MDSEKVKSYTHAKTKRPNNPQVGQIKHVEIPDDGSRQYSHDPHIDPSLSWAGKEENLSFDVDTVSIHVHERIDSKTIIESLQKGSAKSQMSLFNFINEEIPDWKTHEFYSHKNNWSNRLVTGDSLLVMNSLLEMEQMGGKIQTIYIDPPYGINYKSNFQPFVDKTDVKDSDEDLSSEPEQIRAFRDTWELGIHSYLTYMRDRLLLARELLTEKGSCFVQIGSQNVHYMGVLMGEIFGFENRMPTITFTASGRPTSRELGDGSSYLIWYAKDKSQIKYHKLYEHLTRKEIVEHFGWGVSYELPDGTTNKLNKEQCFDPDAYLPENAKLYRRMPLVSQHRSTTGRSEPYEYNGRKFSCPPDMQWAISKEGMDHLAKIGRLEAKEGHKSLRYKEYEDEIPGKEIDNNWYSKMAPRNKVYVVQTANKVIERVLLMTTDPGDLVLDPTCGSGTTAYVAEKWGRRWITCDTSRIAINIAKERLMTSQYDYFKLSHPEDGVDSGFLYETKKTVTAAILGYERPLKEEVLYDRPLIEKSVNRVSGPFTVEAVPSISVKSIDEVIQDEGNKVDLDKKDLRTNSSVQSQEWHNQLFNAGIRGKQGNRIEFRRLEPKAGTKWIHAEGETSDSKLAVVSFGPDSAPLSQLQFDNVLEEAASLFPKPDLIIFAAFHFDPEAAKRIDELISKIPLLKVKMSEDLLTDDLKKNVKSSDTFWLIGQPDIQLNLKGDDYTVSVHGFDYYDPLSGKLESGNSNKIVMWMLDTDYDGLSIFPNQVFFPMAGQNSEWIKTLSKNLKANVDAEEIRKISGTESFSFKSGKRKKIAVKIIDDRGIESIKIMELNDEK